MDKGKPEAGKVYALTGLGNSIANGNTWAESKVSDADAYSNPDKLYQVKLLKTDKNGGFFKTLKEALSKQKEFETKGGYATIIRVNPKTKAPLYGQDGWPIAL